MCIRDTEIVKVAPERVLSNGGNLEGTHLTRSSPGVISGGGLSPYTNENRPTDNIPWTEYDCILYN